MLLQSGGKWLKASEIKNGDIVEIETEVQLVEMPDFNDKEKMTKAFIGNVKWNGSSYKMKFTKPTRNSISPVFGNETNDWVGKKLFLTKIPTASGHFSIWGQPVEEKVDGKIQWNE
jgi:hypothetical protein